WQWLSIAPGRTNFPLASISRAPPPMPRPNVAITPSLTPISHCIVSDAVATVPLRITRSYSAIVLILSCVLAGQGQIAISSSNSKEVPTMPELLDRDVPEDIVEALRRRAAAHGRTEEAELRSILEEAL